jgi:CRP-like cAMP-binding protein/N-acyl-L-homoserine lactone synthetase
VGLAVEPARDDAARERVFAFRYRVYVDEMGLDTPEADHARRWLCDPLDDVSTSWALLRDGEVAGTLRVTCLSDLADPAPLVARFSMQPALPAFGASEICTTSRFMLDPKLRGGTAILRLMAAVYQDGRARGLRLNYGDCSPHLVPFYEHLGYRRYTRAFNDTAYGFKVPILMLTGDRVRFERVRSPLVRLAQEHADDPEARAWFERSYPGELGFETAGLLEEGDFLDLLAERVAGDPLHHVGLLHGLSREEADGFLARATLVQAGPGDRIVRQGETGDTIFVLLSGIAEAVRDERPDDPLAVLGAGDPFGEMGFLTATRRTASVVARTPCEAVVLSGDWLRTFLARQPAVAAKVLLNLSRVLAERLADMNRRHAQVGG